jgi:DNA invertase Pin-like site-specific DNA recombinase
MLIGYMRVSKADGSQTTDLQRDALLAAGVESERLYEELASGSQDTRPGLDAALKSLRAGDTLVVWKLDRLGRNLRHLVNTIHDLTERGIGFKVLTGQGASINTTTPSGKLVFGIFAALAEFERELTSERTKAGLASARARGRAGGAPRKMTVAKLRWSLTCDRSCLYHRMAATSSLGATLPGRTGPCYLPSTGWNIQPALLAEQLAFRGRTALYKLHLPPARYSEDTEDIELVQVAAGPIGPVMDALQAQLNP